MKVNALTADGQWWTIARELTKSEDMFEEMWCNANGGDLIETSEPGIYIQKCNISAIEIDK